MVQDHAPIFFFFLFSFLSFFLPHPSLFHVYHLFTITNVFGFFFFSFPFVDLFHLFIESTFRSSLFISSSPPLTFYSSLRHLLAIVPIYDLFTFLSFHFGHVICTFPFLFSSNLLFYCLILLSSPFILSSLLHFPTQHHITPLLSYSLLPLSSPLLSFLSSPVLSCSFPFLAFFHAPMLFVSSGLLSRVQRSRTWRRTGLWT